MIGRLLRAVALRRARPAEPAPPADLDAAAILAARLDATARTRLGRSLALFHVAAGGCDGCTLELRMAASAVYGLERLGMRFVDTPRHADVLLVSGPVTRTMRDALLRTHAAMPDPKWVVALGECAVDGGPFRGSYAVQGGAGEMMPVDLIVPGCPPAPHEILAGLQTLLAAQLRRSERGAGRSPTGRAGSG